MYENIYGYATVLDTNEPNKLQVTLFVTTPNGIVAQPGKYDVWATDYNNYAHVYSCTEIGNNLKIEFSWLLSRTKTMPEEVKTMLKSKLIEANVDVTNFVATEQTYYNCNN